MIRLGLELYASVGIVWGTGVLFVRLFVDGLRFYPRPWVWILMTVFLWPWSMVISAREIVRGLRGKEWVCGVCGASDWDDHKVGCTNDTQERP